MSFYEGCLVACFCRNKREATGVVKANRDSITYPWRFVADDGSGIAFTFTQNGWQSALHDGYLTERHVELIGSSLDSLTKPQGKYDIDKFFDL